MGAAHTLDPSALTRIGALDFARLNRQELVSHLFERLSRGAGGWLLTANIDYLRQCATNHELRRLYSRADIVGADGIPVVWASRILGSPLPDRLAGSDLIWLIAERAAADGRRLFLLGGDAGAAEATCGQLRTRWPTIEVVGTLCPSVSRRPSPDELSEIRVVLKQTEPDIILVGLGAPKEGRLIEALKQELPGAWWIGVGVSFSFACGRISRAPRWMQRAGLEWVHRLAQEPRRLFRRYLVDDLPFALWLIATAVWAKNRP